MKKIFSHLKPQCAALAFHKSLIGLSQLNALEITASQTELSLFLESRALFTYYVVYHIFCSCMLMAPEKYLQGMKCPLSQPTKYGEVTEEEINAPEETPRQWEKCKKAEQDWATVISHGQIKDFCECIRKMDCNAFSEDAPYLIPLYKFFIDPSGSETTCIPGLYEKLCYVRDRVLYRPSYVLTDKGYIIQTSAQMHRELMSLPKSGDLYVALTEIYKGFISAVSPGPSEDRIATPCWWFLYEMWGSRVSSSVNYLRELGHNVRRLHFLGERESKDSYMFPMYICHLLELESIDFIRKYKMLYWQPLKDMYSCY